MIASLLLALSSASCVVCLREDQTENSEISALNGFGMPNPAAVYCTELGYSYEIKNTKEGHVGRCIFPDKSSCDAWEFYRGERKGEFSYCARRGYKLKTKKNCAWASEGSVCVLPDGGEIGELRTVRIG